MVGGLHCARSVLQPGPGRPGRFQPARLPRRQERDLSSPYARYLIAREITLWHYQWLLVNEHLPPIARTAVVSDVLTRGNQFYRPPRGDAFLPIEFGAAAYRFGHSSSPLLPGQLHQRHRRLGQPDRQPVLRPGLRRHQARFQRAVSYDRDDLLGGFPAPRRYVGWQTFFDFGDGQVKNNKKIDTTISSVMFTMPIPAIAPHTQTSPTVLPQRNLLRQLTWSLPSGQAIAAAMGADPLTPADLSGIAAVYAPFGASTPLWYYILAEARIAAGGLSLGPVGGRIVTETLIGLLRADPASYLNIYPRFRPFLGADLVLGAAPDTRHHGQRATSGLASSTTPESPPLAATGSLVSSPAASDSGGGGWRLARRQARLRCRRRGAGGTSPG